jgi:hypothetical protein
MLPVHGRRFQGAFFSRFKGLFKAAIFSEYRVLADKNQKKHWREN